MRLAERLTLLRDTYRDSVSLMLAAREAEGLEGVSSAAAVSATPLNIDLLERAGFKLGSERKAGPSDLVLAVRARDDQAASNALAAIEAALQRSEIFAGGAEPAMRPRSIAAAAQANRSANLAVISVPGDAAGYECAAALEAGLNVFCFSSGFAVELEATLKRRALERELLLMGPDCGTSIIDGIGIGFANEVRRGPVGIVAASGTGAQAVSCRLDGVGLGVSQLIGVGGRDLSATVGGLMAERAISLLGSDAETECLLVVAKAPDPGVATAIADRAASTGKAAVLAFPGAAPLEVPTGVELAEGLEDAAGRVAALLGRDLQAPSERIEPGPAGAVRGLFCGGTLRDEAVAVSAALGPRRQPLSADRVSDDWGARDVFIDFGSERLTQGRPHPMIDPALRDREVERQAADLRVAAILVDVVLGRCAHPDPAAQLAPAIERVLAARNGALAVVVSLCGAEGDPQGLTAQAETLRAAGATVTRSNAHAARLALTAAAAAPGAAEAAR